MFAPDSLLWIFLGLTIQGICSVACSIVSSMITARFILTRSHYDRCMCKVNCVLDRNHFGQCRSDNGLALEQPPYTPGHPVDQE